VLVVKWTGQEHGRINSAPPAGDRLSSSCSSPIRSTSAPTPPQWAMQAQLPGGGPYLFTWLRGSWPSPFRCPNPLSTLSARILKWLDAGPLAWRGLGLLVRATGRQPLGQHGLADAIAGTSAIYDVAAIFGTQQSLSSFWQSLLRLKRVWSCRAQSTHQGSSQALPKLLRRIRLRYVGRDGGIFGNVVALAIMGRTAKRRPAAAGTTCRETAPMWPAPCKPGRLPEIMLLLFSLASSAAIGLPRGPHLAGSVGSVVGETRMKSGWSTSPGSKWLYLSRGNPPRHRYRLFAA